VILLTVALTIAIKVFYSNAGPDELRWVLYPTAVLVQSFAGMDFLFDPEKGYSAVGAPVVIGPGCAGLNFYVVALCMIVFSFISRFSRHHLYWFFFFVLLTYGVMVVVNAFRIVGGIVLLDLGPRMGFDASGTLHAVQGTLSFFVFLILYFLIVRFAIELREQS
jgi:exosortase K